MTEKRTLIILAHPCVDNSTSHQFLIQTGQTLTNNTDYLDLNKEIEETKKFNSQKELARLKEYHRIIFQFQLFWYQAPAILKRWFDEVFEYDLNENNAQNILKDKELGIVVIAGSKESHYHRSSKLGITMDELLSPYFAFGHYMGMKILPYLSIYQFQYYSEEQQHELIIKYAEYIENGTVDSFTATQEYVINKLEHLSKDDINLTTENESMLEMVRTQMLIQANELDDIYSINDGDNYE